MFIQEPIIFLYISNEQVKFDIKKHHKLSGLEKSTFIVSFFCGLGVQEWLTESSNSVYISLWSRHKLGLGSHLKGQLV